MQTLWDAGHWLFRPVDRVVHYTKLGVGLALVGPSLLIVAARSSFRSPFSLSNIWQACNQLPVVGSTVFSAVIAWQAPYSGSIEATVSECAPGTCQAQMCDRPWLRNPFNSIHALALANLGELASGMAVMFALEDLGKRTNLKTRAIVIGISTEYVKKARGTITARSTVSIPSTVGEHHMLAVSELRNSEGLLVATFTAKWTLEISERASNSSSSGGSSSGKAAKNK
eukprot:m.45102 g.45102  ORF g.45102 m.45102 type:complete len:227 (+) comp12405_c0_seq1:48-728(+)